MTIQQFYRPGGDSTQNRGVVSDVELPSLTTELDVGEADLDYALAFDRVQALQHDDYHMEESPLVQGLKAAIANACKDPILRPRRATDQSLQRRKEGEDGHAEPRKVRRRAQGAQRRQGRREDYHDSSDRIALFRWTTTTRLSTSRSTIDALGGRRSA